MRVVNVVKVCNRSGAPLAGGETNLPPENPARLQGDKLSDRNRQMLTFGVLKNSNVYAGC